jgi:protein-tyrosine phosphatase
VVCRGNVCRSPFAAALLRQALGPLGVRVDSAGFLRANRPAAPDAVAAAARRGVDLSHHRSRLLTPEFARSADVIVVMDPGQQRALRERFRRLERDVIVLGDLDPALPEEGRARTIRDPIGQGPEVFEASYARIERCVGEIARVLGRAR